MTRWVRILTNNEIRKEVLSLSASVQQGDGHWILEWRLASLLISFLHGFTVVLLLQPLDWAKTKWHGQMFPRLKWAEGDTWLHHPPLLQASKVQRGRPSLLQLVPLTHASSEVSPFQLQGTHLWASTLSILWCLWNLTLHGNLFWKSRQP